MKEIVAGIETLKDQLNEAQLRILELELRQRKMEKALSTKDRIKQMKKRWWQIWK